MASNNNDNKGTNVSSSKYFGRKGVTQPIKRKNSEVANTSAEELLMITTDLEEIKSKMNKIDEIKRDMVKKEDLKDMVKTMVSELVKEFKEQMQKEVKETEEKYRERCGHLSDKIDGLEVQNCSLEEQLASSRKEIREMKEKLKECDRISKEAKMRANYNEQYSRKNNIKIHGVKEEKNENTEEVMKSVLKNVANVSIVDSEVVAVHRIPGSGEGARPILVKLKNSAVKARVMKKRSIVKKNGKGVRLGDDVTRWNALLLNQLNAHASVDQAWYFNGSVYAADKAGKRHKFDLYDDIGLKLRAK